MNEIDAIRCRGVGPSHNCWRHQSLLFRGYSKSPKTRNRSSRFRVVDVLAIRRTYRCEPSIRSYFLCITGMQEECARLLIALMSRLNNKSTCHRVTRPELTPVPVEVILRHVPPSTEITYILGWPSTLESKASSVPVRRPGRGSCSRVSQRGQLHHFTSIYLAGPNLPVPILIRSKRKPFAVQRNTRRFAAAGRGNKPYRLFRRMRGAKIDCPDIHILRLVYVG